MTGSQEVVGSNPIFSTRKNPNTLVISVLGFFGIKYSTTTNP